MKKTSKNRIYGFIFIVVSAFFTGFAPAITKLAFKGGIEVETILSARFLIGGICIWIYILLRKSNIRIGKKNIAFLILLGVFGVIATITMNESYKYLPAAIASILVFSYIIIVNFIDIAVDHSKATRSRFVCLGLAILGVIAVVWTPGEGIAFHPLGVFLAIFAAVFYALHSFFVGAKIFHSVSSDVICGYTILIPMIVNVVRCVMSDNPIMPTELGQWGFVLFLGVGSTFIANVLYIMAVKKIGVSDTAITNTMEPVYSYIAGIMLIGDVISLKSIVGGLIILSSIALLNYSYKRQERLSKSTLH